MVVGHELCRYKLPCAYLRIEAQLDVSVASGHNYPLLRQHWLRLYKTKTADNQLQGEKKTHISFCPASVAPTAL